MLLLTTV